MSKIKISGNASGTGVVTLTAPNTNTDRTITLPDDTQTLIGTNASGNVGIGTNSPSEKLEVIQGAGTTTRAVIGGGTAAMLVINGDRDNTGDSGEEDSSLLFTSDGAYNSSSSASGTFSYRIGQLNEGAKSSLKFTEVRASSDTERMCITSAGDVTVNTGNLVIGTSGKGIDFSADGNAAGMTSEVLDDYEEGTWTPTPAQGITGGLTINSARYTKIGRTVTWSMYISTFNGNTSSLRIGGLPFTNQGSSGYSMQSNINSSSSNATITNPHFRIPPSSSVLYALKNNDSLIIGTELDSTHIIASGTYQTD
jgi:hypothetical protein